MLLEMGEHYELIGKTSTHLVNHYGSSSLVANLKALADSVFADSMGVLRYNDMSLIYGGPFDWTANWNTPHQHHREGSHADVDDFNKAHERISLKYLENWISNPPFEGTVEFHTNNHFHVTFD